MISFNLKLGQGGHVTLIFAIQWIMECYSNHVGLWGRVRNWLLPPPPSSSLFSLLGKESMLAARGLNICGYSELERGRDLYLYLSRKSFPFIKNCWTHLIRWRKLISVTQSILNQSPFKLSEETYLLTSCTRLDETKVKCNFTMLIIACCLGLARLCWCCSFIYFKRKYNCLIFGVIINYIFFVVLVREGLDVW